MEKCFSLGHFPCKLSLGHLPCKFSILTLAYLLGHLPCKFYFCTWILAVGCFHSSTYTGIRIDVSVFKCKCGSKDLSYKVGVCFLKRGVQFVNDTMVETVPIQPRRFWISKPNPRSPASPLTLQPAFQQDNVIYCHFLWLSSLVFFAENAETGTQHIRDDALGNIHHSHG